MAFIHVFVAAGGRTSGVWVKIPVLEAVKYEPESATEPLLTYQTAARVPVTGPSKPAVDPD